MEQEPGGGTTDYSVEMFLSAVAGEPYVCFVTAETKLPLMYMPDALEAILKLAGAEERRLLHRTFNVAGFSCTAGEIETEIRSRFPDFVCDYKPDFRQLIAESWPRTIDDSAAQVEWGWHPRFGLQEMADDMTLRLREREAALG